MERLKLGGLSSPACSLFQGLSPHWVLLLLSACTSPYLWTLRVDLSRMTAVFSPFIIPTPRELLANPSWKFFLLAEATSGSQTSVRQAALTSFQSPAHLSLPFTLLEFWFRG